MFFVFTFIYLIPVYAHICSGSRVEVREYHAGIGSLLASGEKKVELRLSGLLGNYLYPLGNATGLRLKLYEMYLFLKSLMCAW